MSLIHWWPLNGNTRDMAGGNDLVLTNNNGKISQNSSGKIGSCYERTAVGTADLLRSKTKLKVFTEQSICTWVYISQHAATNTANGIVSNHSHANNSGLGIGVFVDRADTSKYYVSVNAGNKTSRIHSDASGRGRTNIKNAWHHICLTYAKDGKIRMYVDAVEDMTPLTYSLYSISDYLDIFNWSTTHYTNNDYRPVCKVNDVRVYDHALSKKEIREIYKANILHYDFENITTTLGDNILKDTVISMGSLGATVSNHVQLGPNSMKFTVSGGSTTRMLIPLNLLTANQVYKVSFVVQDISSSSVFRINDWCDSGSVTDLTVRNIGTNRYFISANISRTAYDSTYRFMDFYVSGEGTYYIYNFQICPVVTKIIDGSGYGNDGENNGVTFTTTTPLGTKAASFASGKYIKLPDPFKSSFNEATWSMWINENSGANSYKSIYHTYNSPTGTYWISVNAEGIPLWFYRNGYIRGKGITFTANTFHHIAITFKNGVFQWYFNGNPVTMETKVSPTSLPCSEYMSIGDSYTGTSWGGTPFTGQIADFKIHATALSANDIAEEYKTRIQIARDGSLFANRINEDSVVRDAVFDYKMNANVNGISEYDLKNKFDGNIYEEPDGSKWIRVCHHNNPSSYLFSSGNDFANSVYVDSNRWFNMEVCNYLNSWEIMIKQTLTSGGTEYKYRWTQPKNPMTAVYGDVDKADVTYNTSSGYTSTTYGGMYKNGGKAYLTANSGTNGNWWGATGCWSDYDGIPAWNGQIVSTGYYDVYVRIDNTTITDSGTNFKSFNKGTVYAKNIIEY